jgi:hypothetical protein
LTVKPPLGAGTLSVTVQLSLPDPETDVRLQVSEAIPGVPEPLKAIDVFALSD